MQLFASAESQDFDSVVRADTACRQDLNAVPRPKIKFCKRRNTIDRMVWAAAGQDPLVPQFDQRFDSRFWVGDLVKGSMDNQLPLAQ